MEQGPAWQRSLRPGGARELYLDIPSLNLTLGNGHEKSGEVLCLPGQGKKVPSGRAAWEAIHQGLSETLFLSLPASPLTANPVTGWWVQVWRVYLSDELVVDDYDEDCWANLGNLKVL